MEVQTKTETTEPTYELEEVVYKNQYTTDMNYTHQIIWKRVLVHALLQIGWVVGAYTAIFYAKLATFIWGYGIGFCVSQSIALGAHRCYTHKSFKPTPALHFALVFFHTMAGQNSMYTWVRDHKIHHKYSDTDVDPHNSTRGFFFSHIGWLMVKKHPLAKRKQKEVDMDEIRADKLIMFQYNYFLQCYFFVGFLLPIIVPMYFWNETFWNAFFVAYCLQYVTNLHVTWTINSVAHLWGTKPYDKRIKAVQSTFSWFVTAGEGWHNFHHSFPWDYRLSEFGHIGGISTAVLDLLAYLGLAYDLKCAAPKVVLGHMKRHGDEHGQEILRKNAAKGEMK